ncbi:MAG: pyridoxamine 5'-phosphate oxidase family protein, partial [Chromatocurvus sp.]
MTHKFAEIAFTPSVREIQALQGSRAVYAGMDEGEDYNYRLGEREASFIAERDSFYMASVSETGWPYVQHRGGPVGFMKVLEDRRIGFADYSGNRQYVSVGNFSKDNRVALFFMDYPNRRRLKLLGRVRAVGLEENDILTRLEDENYPAQVERGFVIDVAGFDWNCPQHITPRYSETEVTDMLQALLQENQQLRHVLQERAGTSADPQSTVGIPGEEEVLGEGPLELVVSAVRQLAPRVRAFELRNLQGGELPAAEPGSHLRIPVRLPGGKLVERHYSLASNPARRDIYEIAVLREEQGSGGSRAVYQSYGIG